MQSDVIIFYILTGVITLFGTLAFFFFKSYLTRIDSTFKMVEETLAELENSIKIIREFVARQDEKNSNQTNINSTAETKYTTLLSRIEIIEKQITKIENRLFNLERLNNVK